MADDGWTRRAAVRTALGAGVVGSGAGLAGAQGASLGDWFGDVPNYDGVVDRRGQSEVTVEVGVDTANGPYGFGPAAVRVDPGTTVRFEWVSDTHNVVIETSPTDWPGITDIHDTGYEDSHTFDTEGVYTYFCRPHRSLGMKAAVVVGDVEVSAGGGGGGGPVWRAPGDGFAQVFLGIIAAAVGIGLVAVLGGEWVASRRRRAEERAAELPEGGVTETEEAPATEPARELGHDEYDPTGTATLLVGYGLLLALLWAFMYFVEFLNNGPTVI